MKRGTVKFFQKISKWKIQNIMTGGRYLRPWPWLVLLHVSHTQGDFD